MNDMTTEQTRKQLEALMASDEMGFFRLRVEAITKHQEASALLDEADRKEHVANLGAALESAHQEVARAIAQVDRTAEAAKELLESERAAQDRLGEAVEHARQAAEAEEVARLEDAAPATQTDTLLRLNAAREVVARRQRSADHAATARHDGDRRLAEARTAVSTARSSAKAAQDALDNADLTVQLSPWTLLVDWAARLLQHTSGANPLVGEQLLVVRSLVDGFASQLGLRDRYRAEGREQFETALRERQQSLLLPRPGHALRPASSGQTYMPVTPPLNPR